MPPRKHNDMDIDSGDDAYLSDGDDDDYSIGKTKKGKGKASDKRALGKGKGKGASGDVSSCGCYCERVYANGLRSKDTHGKRLILDPGIPYRKMRRVVCRVL